MKHKNRVCKTNRHLKSKKVRNYEKKEWATNIHHCVNVSSLWKSVEENLIELKVRTHNTIHELFWNKLPHNILKQVIAVLCKPFQDWLKSELYEVLDNWKGKEYKENTYKGKQPRNWPNKWTLYTNKNTYGENTLI